MNLEKQYKEYEKQYKEYEKKENELIKLYETEINKKLETLKKENEYNIYYLILNDLFNYVLEIKKEYKEISYFNKCFKLLNLNEIYNYENYKYYEKLNKKYTIEKSFKILDNNNLNDLYYMIYELIKNDNEILFKDIVFTNLNNINDIIIKIFSYLLKGIIYEYSLFNNTYLEFLEIFNTDLYLIYENLN